MTHTIQEKRKLLNRVRRVKGQIEAVERALENEKGCSELLHLVSAIRGSINGLMAEVIEDHIRNHLDPSHEPDIEQAKEELIDAVKSYLR
ncbi:MAG: transcriptional regulator [Alphaproteobacteria bacterium 16-39-46]|nr:MAG: transcriptional regulator [Alphaproteobacteria bacterium 16-39-46]OZA42745.1 MAG: transcriptional regulator [Alphaproteobacteria bacterium 17-39-52]HQS84286.1 metal/formaldehyde-sensitive transcriptional repressor [Alphaproteobacteria bacterium]HQS93127.1 metal/formaldehyde-sensitive transcriptional repressor [Alphaproteobacteria bacterium]